MNTERNFFVKSKRKLLPLSYIHKNDYTIVYTHCMPMICWIVPFGQWFPAGNSKGLVRGVRGMCDNVWNGSEGLRMF